MIAMSDELTTERLLLRPYRLSDAEDLVRHLTQFKISKMLARVPHPYRIDDALAFLKQEDPSRLAQFAISRRDDQNSALIGAIGVFIGDSGAPTLGYWLAREAAGQGLMSEAVATVLRDSGVKEHRTIEASAFIDNPASSRVLQKTGFIELPSSGGRGYSLARKCEVEQRRFIWHSDEKMETL